MRSFFESSEDVLQPGLVCTVCSTSKLVGLLSLMMVRVPSRCELKASMVLGLKPPPSVPLPMGSVARIVPLSAPRTTQMPGLAHMAKRMWFFTSGPEGQDKQYAEIRRCLHEIKRHARAL